MQVELDEVWALPLAFVVAAVVLLEALAELVHPLRPSHLQWEEVLVHPTAP